MRLSAACMHVTEQACQIEALQNMHEHALAGTAVQDPTMAMADQVGIFFAQPLSGIATLVIKYSYSLVKKDTGFYLDPYTALDGTQYLYAATKLEVCSATCPVILLSVITAGNGGSVHATAATCRLSIAERTQGQAPPAACPRGYK